ncbi:hypothetical protein [Aeromicrobium sp. P5_D10]
MRKLLAAMAASALLITLPGPVEAATKKFAVTIKAPSTVYYRYPTPVGDRCEDLGPQGGEAKLTIKITGTVRPIRAGKYVTIYKKFVGGHGVVEGKARVRSSGRFTFLDRPTSSRTRYYKAKMPTTGSYKTGFSKYTRVKIEGFCDE